MQKSERCHLRPSHFMKVTIPQPFKMTIRDEQKAGRRKQLNVVNAPNEQHLTEVPKTVVNDRQRFIETNRRRSTRSDSEVRDLPDLSPIENVARHHRVIRRDHNGQSPSVKQTPLFTMKNKFLANPALSRNVDVADQVLDDGRVKTVSSAYATDFPSPRTTLTALLRESVNRYQVDDIKRAEEEQRRKENEFVQDFVKRKELADLRSAVTQKTSNLSQNKGVCTTGKENNFNKAHKERAYEYHEEIQSMLKRVRNRPLLMERQSQLSAVCKVEKLFKDRLQKEGLDAEFVLKCSEKAKVESQSLSVSTDHSNSSTCESEDLDSSHQSGSTSPDVNTLNNENSEYSTVGTDTDATS